MGDVSVKWMVRRAGKRAAVKAADVCKLLALGVTGAFPDRLRAPQGPGATPS
jgi:hypothetical protein